MATLNFPNTLGQPTDGSFTYIENNVIYSWNGTYWSANNTTGLDSRYVNVNGDTMTGDLTVPSLNGGQLAGFRNQIINGDFRVWQRGTSVTLTTISLYTADRWKDTGSNIGATCSRSTTAPAGFTYSFDADASTGNIQQGIELDGPGTNGQFPIGSVWTLSLWCDVDISTQTPSFRFRTGVGKGPDQVEAATTIPTFTSTGETSNGFTRYSTTFTISGDVTTSVATLLCLNLSLPSAGAVGARKFAGVQLEPGPVATPFEHRPIGTELALCQRYYYQHPTFSGGSYFAVGAFTSNSLRTGIASIAPVTFRTTPTITATGINLYGNDNVTGYPATSAVMHNEGILKFSGAITTSTHTNNKLYSIRGNTGSVLSFDAEL